MRINNVVLPNKGPDQRFDVEISGHSIRSIAKSSSPSSSPPSLLLPALCHPHIHLDKPFLLTSHPKPPDSDEYPDYSDLSLESGDFSEALSKTGQAKTRYTVPDLVFRGSQLIAESIQAGVTSMRAFVEVDHVTKFKCVDAAVELKQKFDQLCYVQICAFAQDPVMSTEHGNENRRLMEEALDRYQGHIEVLGSTPYVEEDTSYGAQNVDWAVKLAIEKKLHLDFHLDYSISSSSEALIWKVLDSLKEARWTETAGSSRRIAIGHCPRMTLFDRTEMKRLVDRIADLPIAFVGLPTSDIFMMGRPTENDGGYGRRERGTMQIVDMIQKDGLQACIGVNNTGNAFTPWGSVDPIRLACMGVGIYQAGTVDQAKILYECISTRARRAIGLQAQKSRSSQEVTDDFDLTDEAGVDGGILVISNETDVRCPALRESVPARQRITVTDVIWDPPELASRRIASWDESS